MNTNPILFGLKPSPDQDGTNKKRIFQIGPSVPKEIIFKHRYIQNFLGTYLENITET